MNEPTDYVKRTEENTQPHDTHYDELSYMAGIVKIGEAYREIFNLFSYDPNSAAYNALDELFVGNLPIYYADEVVGYLREEDGNIFYHKAELKDKS